jgi:hypothetical protein
MFRLTYSECILFFFLLERVIVFKRFKYIVWFNDATHTILYCTVIKRRHFIYGKTKLPFFRLSKMQIFMINLNARV